MPVSIMNWACADAVRDGLEAHARRGGDADSARGGKVIGLLRLPSRTRKFDAARMSAANLADDISAWTRLLAMPDHDDLAVA
jgi:hypothetical protein